MSSKKKQELNEGPLDFMRGAGAEVGRKVANSAPVQAGRDVVNAGRAASAQGNIASQLTKAIAQLASMMAYIDKAGSSVDLTQQQQQQPQGQQQQPSQQQQAQAKRPQQQGQQQQQQSGNPFVPNQKPRFVMKNGMQQYQFNSFLQAIHGEKLDEGVWDFVKGAGKEAGTKIRDKINDYAARPSMLKDIYNAGKAASIDGDAKKVEATKAQAKKQVEVILGLAKQLGPAAPQVIAKAVRQAGGPYQNRILRVIAKNAQARGINVI